MRRGARDEGAGPGGRNRGLGGEEAVAVRGGDGRSVGAGLLLRRRAGRRAPRPSRALPLNVLGRRKRGVGVRWQRGW